MSMFINSLGIKIAERPVLYYILIFTWGLPLTLLGLLLTIFLLPFGKIRRYNYIYYIELNTNGRWGFAMGNMFVVSHPNTSLMVKSHEFGHTVQNAILGPLMILLVAIPSVVRFHYRAWYRKKHAFHPLKVKMPAYDSIWFEHSANIIGNNSISLRELEKKPYIARGGTKTP